MTTTVTSLAANAVSMHSYDALSTTIGVAVIAAMAFLLLVRELAPVLRGGNAPRETGALDSALLPLLMVFAIIVLARLAELLA